MPDVVTEVGAVVERLKALTIIANPAAVCRKYTAVRARADYL